MDLQVKQVSCEWKPKHIDTNMENLIPSAYSTEISYFDKANFCFLFMASNLLGFHHLSLALRIV